MKIKKLMNYFPSLVNWDPKENQFLKFLRQNYPAEEYASDEIDPRYKINLFPCVLKSYQKSSNLLETINLSINRLGNLHIDQPLNLVGMQIIIVSGGYGIYKLNPDIACYTRQRVLQHGVHVRIVSLDRCPYIYPIFLYRSNEDPGNTSSNPLLNLSPD
jgi:hypothetical protein